MAPTGDALTGQWRNENGNSSFAVMGWQADKKIVMATGYGSDGSYWQAEFDTFTEETQEGAHRGRLPDGMTYEGRIVITKIDADNCKWEFTGKNGEGEAHSMNGKITRKK